MRPHMRNAAVTACVVALTLTAGCSIPGTSGNSTGGTGPVMGGGSTSTGSRGGMMEGGSASSYSSDGLRIYLSGVGTDGQSIARTAPAVSQGSLMMGGGGCGSCHGQNGRGATIKMMAGTAIEAPDITYAALIKAGFTDTTIRSAIRDGIDESGQPLKDAMPRWQMSETDLDATITYLKVLGPQ
jgi:mono/diheme cytochrome c family protein